MPTAAYHNRKVRNLLDKNALDALRRETPKPSKFLTLFDTVFEMTADGTLRIDIDGDGGVALHASLTKAEVAQLRALLAE